MAFVQSTLQLPTTLPKLQKVLDEARALGAPADAEFDIASNGYRSVSVTVRWDA